MIFAIIGGLIYFTVGFIMFITTAPSAEYWQHNNSWIKTWLSLGTLPMFLIGALLWPLHLVLIFSFEKNQNIST